MSTTTTDMIAGSDGLIHGDILYLQVSTCGHGTSYWAGPFEFDFWVTPGEAMIAKSEDGEQISIALNPTDQHHCDEAYYDVVYVHVFDKMNEERVLPDLPGECACQ